MAGWRRVQKKSATPVDHMALPSIWLLPRSFLFPLELSVRIAPAEVKESMLIKYYTYQSFRGSFGHS